MIEPVFSIIIPTFNRADLLPRAIQSVLAQTFTDFELIVVDDGSTDNTREITQYIKDARLRYVYQKNKGVSAARNAGVALAGGHYVTFLDSDDEALPEWLDHFVQIFREDDKVGIVCVGTKIITEQQGQRKEILQLPQGRRALVDNHSCLFRPPGVFALRRELFEAVGGYAEGLVYGENTELVMRLVSHCKQEGAQVVSIAKPLVLYYKQLLDRSKAHENYKVRLESIEYILNRHGDNFRKDPHAYGLFLAMAGANAAKIGAYRRARHYFQSAILVHPWNWKHFFRFFLALVPELGRKYWLRHDGGL